MKNDMDGEVGLSAIIMLALGAAALIKSQRVDA